MGVFEKLKFDATGLIPAVIQEEGTNKVLMVAYMNADSLMETIKTKRTVFYSRSRNELWRKGETSGHVQEVVEILTDCDCDCLLVRVKQKGAACHTGKKTCFFKELKEDELIDYNIDKAEASILGEVFDVVYDRKINPVDGSYTNYLFDKGIDKILKKVGEESAETIIAAKNNVKDEIALEMSDLLYHLIVMLVDRGMSLTDIYEELKKRR